MLSAIVLVESASTAAPQARDQRRDLQLVVRDRAVRKELIRRAARRDQEARLVEEDHQQQRQQRDGGEIERDGDDLVIAAVEMTRREVEADERQAEHGERPRDALDRVIPAVRDEIEQAAAHEQERAEIQRDLRVRQRAALDDPVVVAASSVR